METTQMWDILQGCSNGRATVLSTLQQEAWDFVNTLMAGPIADRPTAEQALRNPFLSSASVRSAKKEMQLLLPHFCWDRSLLPIMPLGLPSLEQAEDDVDQSEIIVLDKSWAITALLASLAPPGRSPHIVHLVQGELLVTGDWGTHAIAALAAVTMLTSPDPLSAVIRGTPSPLLYTVNIDCCCTWVD